MVIINLKQRISDIKTSLKQVKKFKNDDINEISNSIYSITLPLTLSDLKLKIYKLYNINNEYILNIYSNNIEIKNNILNCKDKDIIEFEVIYESKLLKPMINASTNDRIIVDFSKLNKKDNVSAEDSKDLNSDSDLDDDENLDKLDMLTLESNPSNYSESNITEYGESVSLHLFKILNSNNHQISNIRKQELKLKFSSILTGPFKIGEKDKDHYNELANDYGIMKVHSSLFNNHINSLFNLNALTDKLVVLILCVGGRFSAIICKSGDVITHKTMHRYVVRKKQGGRQVTHDKSNSVISVGSQIRRQQEARLVEDIRQQLANWAGYLLNADIIYCYAPGINGSIIFEDQADVLDLSKGNSSLSNDEYVYKGNSSLYQLGENRDANIKLRIENHCVLNSKDIRLRSIPFNTSKATLEQALYCYRMFYTAYCHFKK